MVSTFEINIQCGGLLSRGPGVRWRQRGGTRGSAGGPRQAGGEPPGTAPACGRPEVPAAPALGPLPGCSHRHGRSLAYYRVCVQSHSALTYGDEVRPSKSDLDFAQ